MAQLELRSKAQVAKLLQTVVDRGHMKQSDIQKAIALMPGLPDYIGPREGKVRARIGARRGGSR